MTTSSEQLDTAIPCKVFTVYKSSSSIINLIKYVNSDEKSKDSYVMSFPGGYNIFTIHNI